MDICCRKGSRSPLQELYNPIQVSLGRRCAPEIVGTWRFGGGRVEQRNCQRMVWGDLKPPSLACRGPGPQHGLSILI